ncbi:MAG: PorP/SprF family type IX secretion system membrane protein [Saprospiraceae bacterium]
MKKYLLLFFLFPLFLVGQDTHFSGSYAMREYINPALATSYKGSEQASVTYRRQWSSLGSDFPFQSYAFSFNKKWEWQGYSEFSGNLRLMKDSTPGSAFIQNQVIMGANYKKLIGDGYNKAQYIMLGFSGGVGQNRANWNGLWFGNQFNFEQGSPDVKIDSGENISELLSNKTFSDLNLGVAYQINLPRFSMNAGITLSHLTKPDISFVPNLEIRNERKIAAQVSLNVLVKENLYFLFTPYYSKQGVFHEARAKIGLAFAGDEDYDINFGVAVAPSMVQNFEGLGFESLSLQIFLEKSEYRFDIAYDATISKLSTFNGGRGAFEFSFTYTRKNHDNKSPFVRHFHHL